MGLYFLIMLTDSIAKISTAAIITFGTLIQPLPQNVVATHEISLEDRYPVKSVSNIFKDNILLNLAYMDGKVTSAQNVNWDEVKKPISFAFRLDPNQTFSFHDDVLPQYNGKVVKTTNAHFNFSEGFKSDGYLFGDGVCHLASLIYWVAKDANLDALAPTNHDFMNIPEIPKIYGVSIFSNPYQKGSHAQQNLYVTNNKAKPISFKFEYSNDKLKVSVVEEN